MSNDVAAIRTAAQTYLDGLYEGDADKLAAIVHPSADLRSLEKGELQVLHLPAWLNWMRKRPSEVPPLVESSGENPVSSSMAATTTS